MKKRDWKISSYIFWWESLWFYYLKEHNMITYSTAMAYLYGFPDKDGFDWKRHSQGEPFKRVKGPVLEKQKNGCFN